MNNVRQVWRNVSRIGRPLRAAIRLPIVAVLLVSTAAFAQDNQRLTLTIYNSDLALVEDVRSLDLAAGRSRLEFKDVSAMIRPETVTLNASGVGIVEQNFDFDLLTPEIGRASCRESVWISVTARAIMSYLIHNYAPAP